MTKKMKNTFIAAFTTLALGIGMLACGTLNNVNASATDGTPASDFLMAGASVRLFEVVEGQDDNSAIRFVVQMSDEKYASVYEENSGYTVGALLLPADCTEETTLTKTTVTNQGAKIYEQALAASDWRESSKVDGYMEAYVDLYNFPKGDYNREIYATGYIYDGENYTYTYEYAEDGETKKDQTITRSMAQVANLAINDTSADAPSDDQKALAANYILSYAVNYVDAETGDTILTSSAKYGETVTVPEHTEKAEITGAYVDQAKTTAFAGEIKGTTTVYATGAYFAGSGTEADPYQIADAADLNLFAKQVNDNAYTYADKFLKITANIDLGAGTEWTPIAKGFVGTLDGDSKNVSNVNITATTSNAGFFAIVHNATIKNLNLDVDITGTETVGGLVGIVETGVTTITNCSVSGSVTATLLQVGGIVGNSKGTLNMESCVNYANVTANNSGEKTNILLGGIIGGITESSQYTATFKDCVNKGTITLNASKGGFVGGVAGLLRARTGASISNCYNYGNIVVPASSTWVAGVVGCNRITMTDCYCLNTATITVGETVNTASALTAWAKNSSSTVYYLAGTSVDTTITGGLCDADGSAITE